MERLKDSCHSAVTTLVKRTFHLIIDDGEVLSAQGSAGETIARIVNVQDSKTVDRGGKLQSQSLASATDPG